MISIAPTLTLQPSPMKLVPPLATSSSRSSSTSSSPSQRKRLRSPLVAGADRTASSRYSPMSRSGSSPRSTSSAPYSTTGTQYTRPPRSHQSAKRGSGRFSYGGKVNTGISSNMWTQSSAELLSSPSTPTHTNRPRTYGRISPPNPGDLRL